MKRIHDKTPSCALPEVRAGAVSRRKRLLGTCVSTALTLGLAVSPSIGSEGAPDPDEKRCPPVAAETIETVIPELYQKALSDETAYIYEPPYDRNAYLLILNDRNQKIADELGLTIHNFHAEFSDLKADLWGDNGSVLYGEEAPNIPVEVYYKRTEQFLSKYGVDLLFGDTEPYMSDPRNSDQPYNYEKMVSENATDVKLNLYGIAAAISKFPVELVQQSLETVYLVKDLYFTDNIFPPSGFKFGDQPVVFINVNSSSKEWYRSNLSYVNDALIHEFGHTLDVKICGSEGSNIDSQFSDLNPLGSSQYYAANRDNSVSYLGVMNQSDRDGYSATEKSREIGKILAQAVAIEDYGLNRMIEDKATLYTRVVFRMDRRIDLDSYPKVIRDKIRLLYARLYEGPDGPAITEYILRSNVPIPTMTYDPDRHASLPGLGSDAVYYDNTVNPNSVLLNRLKLQGFRFSDFDLASQLGG